MPDPQQLEPVAAGAAWITPSVVTACVGAVIAFGRWLARLWEGERKAARDAAAVAAATATAAAIAAAARREAFEASIAAAARADNDRSVAALLESARSNAQLAGKIDTLTDKLDTLGSQVFESISKVDTPIMEAGSQRHRRARTAPMGYPTTRDPRPGSHHDEGG